MSHDMLQPRWEFTYIANFSRSALAHATSSGTGVYQYIQELRQNVQK